jgi:hypothetical protein
MCSEIGNFKGQWRAQGAVTICHPQEIGKECCWNPEREGYVDWAILTEPAALGGGLQLPGWGGGNQGSFYYSPPSLQSFIRPLGWPNSTRSWRVREPVPLPSRDQALLTTPDPLPFPLTQGQNARRGQQKFSKDSSLASSCASARMSVLPWLQITLEAIRFPFFPWVWFTFRSLHYWLVTPWLIA